MQKYLAVFDWNGTLFDDLPANYSGANAALAVFGAGPISMESYLDTFTFPILHFYTAHGISTDDYLARHEAASQAFLNTYEYDAQGCSLRPGVRELLTWLKAHQVSCMVLSNHLQENLEHQIARMGIGDLLYSVSGNAQSDAAMITKLNKSERLTSFMKKHDFTAANSFIIGDSHEEQDIGQHMDMTCFSIEGGCLSRARLEKGHHDAIISHFGEIPPLLKARWARFSEF